MRPAFCISACVPGDSHAALKVGGSDPQAEALEWHEQRSRTREATTSHPSSVCRPGPTQEETRPKSLLSSQNFFSRYSSRWSGHVKIMSVREFRDKATGYLRSKDPVLVTQQGTIGGGTVSAPGSEPSP